MSKLRVDSLREGGTDRPSLRDREWRALKPTDAKPTIEITIAQAVTGSMNQASAGMTDGFILRTSLRAEKARESQPNAKCHYVKLSCVYER